MEPDRRTAMWTEFLETLIIRGFYEMAVQSLPPEHFENLERIISQLLSNRHLKDFRDLKEVAECK